MINIIHHYNSWLIYIAEGLSISLYIKHCSGQLRPGFHVNCLFLHVGSETHHGPRNALDKSLCISFSSLIHALSEYFVLVEWFLFVSSWQPILETPLKSANVKCQHYSHTSGATFCRPKYFRDSNLTFPRRDSQYLFWFELEMQKNTFLTPPELLTLHATSI